VDGTKVEKTVEKPRYGGTFVGAFDRALIGFDDAFMKNQSYKWVTGIVGEELITGDWSRGTQGTEEAAWLIQGTYFMALQTGAVAESWEIMPGENKAVLKIRQGVHFHNKPPVNGREVNANDVVFSMNRLFSSTMSSQFSVGLYLESFSAPDKWTVVVESKPGKIGTLLWGMLDAGQIVAPEAIEKFGDQRDWRNFIGTGPFEMIDHVPGSSTTLVRNPNYWMTDPIYKGNELPYLDSVKWLVIVDSSTRLAGLRTGKLDWLGGRAALRWEDAASIRATNPEIKQSSYPQAAHPNCIFMRIDKKPFDDVRVRQALAMAMNNQEIKDEFYGGEAVILSTPVAPYAEMMDFYTPLEEQSKIVQEMYEYHPDKAKQLLAEAGYPDGFKTSVVCHPPQVDLLSVIQAYWAEVGVDLEIQVKEWGVLQSIRYARSHEQMIMTFIQSVACFAFNHYRPEIYANCSMVDDPKANATWEVMSDNLLVNEPAVRQALKVFYPYALEQAWHIEPPTPMVYTVWQPWIKGYGGEQTVGLGNWFNFVPYIWCDQDLKEEMKGK